MASRCLVDKLPTVQYTARDPASPVESLKETLLIPYCSLSGMIRVLVLARACLPPSSSAHSVLYECTWWARSFARGPAHGPATRRQNILPGDGSCHVTAWPRRAYVRASSWRMNCEGLACYRDGVEVYNTDQLARITALLGPAGQDSMRGSGRSHKAAGECI